MTIGVLFKFNTGHCMPQLSGRLLLKCFEQEQETLATACLNCQAGLYSNTTQATVCLSCQAGLY